MKVIKESDVKANEALAAAGPPQDSIHMGGSSSSSAAAVAAGSVLNWAVSSLITSTGLAVSATKPSPTSLQAKSSAGLSKSTPTKSAAVSNPGVAKGVSKGGGSSGGGGWDDLDDGIGVAGGEASASQSNGWEAEDEEMERIAEAEAEAERLARARLTSKPAPVRAPPSTTAAAAGHVALPSTWAEKDEEEIWEDMAQEKPKPKPRPGAKKPSSAGGSMKLGVSKLGATKVNQD